MLARWWGVCWDGQHPQQNMQPAIWGKTRRSQILTAFLCVHRLVFDWNKTKSNWPMLKLLTTVTGQGGEISKEFSFGWKCTSRKWKSPSIGAKNELHVEVNGDELGRAIPQDMDQNCCWEMSRQDGKHGVTTSYFVSILQQWGRNLTSQDCSAAITQTYGVQTAPLESLSNASRKPMSGVQECSHASILMSKAQTRASSPYSVHYVTELQAYMLVRNPAWDYPKAEHYPAVGQPLSELQSQILLNHTL